MIRTHTVVAGETLSALALRFYGDAELDRLIATASGIANPERLVNVGQRLIFPDFTQIHGCRRGHAVGVGARFYGDAELYPLIATASGIAESRRHQCGAIADHPGNHETHGGRRGHAVGVGCAFLR